MQSVTPYARCVTDLPADRPARSPFPRRAGVVSLAVNAAAMAASRTSLIVYHRYTVLGTEHLPKATPFVMVANHTSHLDHLCLRNALPLSIRVRTHPLAAGDVFFTSFLRAAVSTHIINALPIWRRKITPHAMIELRNLLAAGQSGIVMFPEGQRSEDGEPARFKAGIGMLVAGTPIPVIPAWISGAGGPGGALQKFRWFPRPRKITVRFGPALTFAHASNDRDGWDTVIEGVEQAVKAQR